ncbi:Na/Pi symporter [Pleurocapsales cyanobacterium LEGE 06147]|nr:Na/Pi symporter [Pleurocapsales cyanobacterium LEGE 06147]
MVEPIAEFIVGLTQETGWLVLIVAFTLLYFALQNLVKLLRSLLDKDLEGKVRKYLFGSAWQAMLFGFLITTAVQSSSITTSVVIPIIALGVVVAIQALPYFLGANVGTSTTALIAAMSLASDGSPDGIASLNVTFVHMVLEFFAIALLFPIRKVRNMFIWLAEKGADILTRGRVTAIVYVAIIFYLLPFGVVMLTQDWQVATDYEPVVPPEVEQLEAEEAEAVEDNGDATDILEEADTETDNGDNNNDG